MWIIHVNIEQCTTCSNHSFQVNQTRRNTQCLQFFGRFKSLHNVLSWRVFRKISSLGYAKMHLVFLSVPKMDYCHRCQSWWPNPLYWGELHLHMIKLNQHHQYSTNQKNLPIWEIKYHNKRLTSQIPGKNLPAPSFLTFEAQLANIRGQHQQDFEGQGQMCHQKVRVMVCVLKRQNHHHHLCK